MTKILIAEDHRLVREGLKLLLSIEMGLDVVGETGNGAEVEQLVRDTAPDLVLLDLDLPNCHGTHITTAIKSQSAAIKILILTGSLQSDAVRRALEAGADGYVLKHDDSSELLEAIRAVLAGERYLSKSIAAIINKAGLSQFSHDNSTPREQEIMCLIARGLSNDEIATALNRSVLTVRKHRQNLMEKLHLRNAAEVTAYVLKHELCLPD